MKNICPICSKSFTPTNKGQKACSIECRLAAQRKNPTDVFVNNIDKCGDIAPHMTTKCWLWTGGIHDRNDTYGKLWVNGKSVKAHRFSWEYFNKTKIPDGMIVRHKCDVKQCVNPNHLLLGTKKDNAKDAVVRGRMYTPKGEKCNSSKLTEKQVREIRKLRHEGEVLQAIALRYGVCLSTVHSIVVGKTWGWLE